MNTDRSWRQVETFSILETPDDENAQVYIAGVLQTYFYKNGLLLPESIFKQMKESVLDAVQGYFGDDRSSPVPGLAANTIQFVIHLADPEAPYSGNVETSSARWGYFLVQRRGSQPNERQLYLDLYLYQE